MLDEESALDRLQRRVPLCLGTSKSGAPVRPSEWPKPSAAGVASGRVVCSRAGPVWPESALAGLRQSDLVVEVGVAVGRTQSSATMLMYESPITACAESAMHQSAIISECTELNWAASLNECKAGEAWRVQEWKQP